MYGLPKSVCVVPVIPMRDMFCLCFCMSEVISSFRSFRAGSQVILHTMSSGKSLQLLCILPFGMFSLSAISMMFVKILLAVCMLVGMVV